MLEKEVHTRLLGRSSSVLIFLAFAFSSGGSFYLFIALEQCLMHGSIVLGVIPM